jgi:hypothetical protein
MGLDFNGAEAHWSYSGFSAFRRKLAKEIGINLDSMQGFGGDLSWKNIQDPICILLNHSDCDGTISHTLCKKVAPRLRRLIESWDDTDYDKQQALLLAKGMEECANWKKTLEFC